MKRLAVIILMLVGSALAVPLIAEENPEAQKDWFVQFVEGQLSAPDRQISISGIEGVLSSDVTIPEITVSDGEGVWLRIENATLNWDQGALLGGTLKINTLSAEHIDYIRPAVPTEGIDLPPPEAQELEIPQFPLAIILGDLNVPRVSFGDEVFGLGSEIAVAGRLQLIDGSLDTALDITRKDGPGGTLALKLKYDRPSENADIDLTLNEPPDGLIVNMLNMAGKPDVSLHLAGSGVLSALRTDMNLDVGGKRALTGLAQLKRVETGLMVDAELYGPIADLVPADTKKFFGAETRLSTNLTVRDAGGVAIDSFTLNGGELALEARADTTSDGFLKRLVLAADIGANGARVKLPGGGGKTSVLDARLTIDYGAGETWTANLGINGLETADMAAESLTLDLSGAASDLEDPDKRQLTFNGDGAIAGITSNDPQLAEALGTEMGLGIAGLWSPQAALKLAELRLSGEAFDMVLKGTVKDFAYSGDIALRTPSIASFSGLVDRQLGGALDLKASGTLEFLSGGFDLSLDGKADNLTLGIAPLDAVLAGQTVLAGRLARGEEGVTADGFTIGNPHSRIGADGSFSSDAADFRFTLALDDFARLSPHASGALTATGTARGAGGTIDLAFEANVPTGSLADHRVREARFGFGGRLADGALAGTITGAAFLDGHRVDLAAGLTSDKSGNRLSDLRFETLGTTVTGGLAQNADGLLTGTLDLEATDLTLAAALFLTEAKGAATASIALNPVSGAQSATISAKTRDLTVTDAIRIGSASVEASVLDLFGVPSIDGTLDGERIDIAGLALDRLSAKANRRGEATDFSAEAALDNGASLAAGGSLAPAGEGYRLTLERAQLDQDRLSAKLVGQTSVMIEDDAVTIEGARFDIGGGRITSSGTAGKALDLTVELEDVPLAVANALLPDLGMAGTANGRLHLTGTTASPEIAFDISGSGIEAASIAGYGVTPLSVRASGSFADDTLRLSAFDADGPGGVSLAASGSLPLVGDGGSLSVTGSIPLAIANRMVAGRGMQVSGTLAVDARLTGSLAKPSYAGTISTADAEIVDPLSNLRLGRITATARLGGETLTIERFEGALATGGTFGVSGTVSLKEAEGFPADLTIALNSARYADGNLFVATLSGRLALSGALLRSPLLSGDIALEKAEIAIPDSLDTDAALLQVENEAPPPGVAATLRRIEKNAAGTTGGGSSGSLQLDVAISAPNQVFVRGRGVDAELGGQLRLTGPVDAIEPVGGFELIRGRLTILGQRIVFNSGTVSLTGNLDPTVDLTATSPGADITVIVTVRGPVSDLEVSFSSTPELPRDEVLAQLIFKRSLGDLTPLQLARLAAAAAELAGGGSNSLVDSLRSAAGFADLDLVTDAEGNTAVRAGTYLQDNLYVSVEAGAQGKSTVSIDLNLTDNLKATGSTTTDGESSIGLFYEQDF